MNEPINIFIISDSIGETAEQVARAATSQFVNENIRFRHFSHIRTKEQIENILATARPRNSLIMFTLVIENLRKFIIERSLEYKLRVVDVLRPVITELTDLVQHKPAFQPGILHRVDEHYFDRISAIEFAVQFDDGKQIKGIEQADLVLLGVSRTSKTPLSMYLAIKYYKVANFPLIPDIPLPDSIFKLSKEKIIGLTADPNSLRDIRKERSKIVGLCKESDYANLRYINQELEYARKVLKKIGCKVFDVTSRAVEETASLILEYLESMSGSINNNYYENCV